MPGSSTRLVSRFGLALALSAMLLTSFSSHRADARSRQAEPARTSKSDEMLSLLRAIKSEVHACNEELQTIRSEMDDVHNEVATLGEDLRPCTPDRYRAGSCGDSRYPFDLEVTLCGILGAEAEVTGSFAIENHNSLELGVGWGEAVHVKFDRQVQFPGIPGAVLLAPPGSAIFGVPVPDLKAEAGGYGGVEISGCIEGVNIPIAAEMSREQVLALVDELERGASELQASMLRSIEQRNLTPERIAGAIDAVEDFQENRFSPHELGMRDPTEIFQAGPLREVANALPVGGRMQELLDEPQQLIPAFDVGLSGTIESVGDLCEQDLSDRPTVETALVPICDLLDQAPSFGRLAASLELIGELPDEIKSAVADLLPEVNVDEIPAPRTGDTQRRVCSALPFLPRCR